MSARLVFLGRLGDLVSGGELAVAPGPLADVLAALEPQLALALADERVRHALNGQLLARETAIELAAGDELAFLPPVSGG
ncbi:MoaD/ThiS family protein [Novosphingobium sp.]|uniref:MoaD/ThiS family protein n=1 Tax=Novosphingobium sp. TaxID=1874826 RepID=UPI0025D81EE7|nr:MoaD/ThiS family protein [Novosphingobium sp.]MCC6924489.1 MoaD/ThiS family protein [Novosphingobium sp.]